MDLSKDEHRDAWVLKQKEISDKLTDISEIRHQIHNICATAPDYLDVAMKIKEKMDKLNGLEKELAELRRVEVTHFVGSLGLKQYNLSHSIQDTIVHVVPTITVSTSPQPVYKGGENPAEGTSGSLSPTFGQDEDSDDDAPLPLKRTMSTAVGTFKQKTPAERWKSLMRMFREWRKYKEDMEKNRELALTDEKKAKEEERVILRSMIYGMHQHKSLSREEEMKVRGLSARLKVLDEELTGTGH